MNHGETHQHYSSSSWAHEKELQCAEVERQRTHGRVSSSCWSILCRCWRAAAPGPTSTRRLSRGITSGPENLPRTPERAQLLSPNPACDDDEVGGGFVGGFDSEGPDGDGAPSNELKRPGDSKVVTEDPPTAGLEASSLTETARAAPS